MKLPGLIFALVAAQSPAAPPIAPAVAQDFAQHVQVSLSVRDGKAVFRSGEPIRLIVSFAADRPGYHVDTVIDKNARLEDQIQISPDTGVVRWQELRSMPDSYGRDYGSSRELSARPTEMTLPLNYWLRFDAPGEYTVRVRTRRVNTAARNLTYAAVPWLITNEVAFRVVTMSDHEEELEARRLSARLDALPPDDLKAQMEACEDLAFLTGDAGTREKVRRYLRPQGKFIGNWRDDLGMGLYISRNTSVVVGMLEADLRDPTRPVTQIHDLAALRLFSEMPSLVAEANGDMTALRGRKRARLQALRTEYVTEAIASLPNRTGSARRETAANVVSLLRTSDGGPRPATLDPLPVPVRTVLVDEFSDLDPMMQGHLVQQHWKDIRDPRLLPALERMLTSSDPWVRGQPIAAILDLAPERAKPLFVAEMLRPGPASSPQAFMELRDETLPELDGPLLEQITRLAASANSRDHSELQTKSSYLARYSSAANLGGIQHLLDTDGSRLSRDVRVNLMAYLDRWDEAGSSGRLDRALAAETDDTWLLYRMAKARYSKAQDAVNRARLDASDPRTVQEAASLLSQHGPADARAVLEARLSRWLTEWNGRTAELEPDPKVGTPQAGLQISLIRAILDGKAWKVSDTDAIRLKQSCLTERCRAAFAAR